MTEIRHVIFCHLREKKTLKLINTLLNQNINNIVVYSDGWRNEIEFLVIKNLRKRLSKMPIRLIERNFNYGLYYNIVDAFEYELQNSNGEPIVFLEEDLILSKFYSRYIDAVAELLENSIYSISLMSYYNKNYNKFSYFKINRFFCWGWVANKNFLKNSNWNRIKFAINNKKLNYLKSGFDVKSSKNQALIRESNSWAIFGVINSILKNKKNIMLTKGLTLNNGFDGVHVKSYHKELFSQTLIQSNNYKHISQNDKIKVSIVDLFSIYWRFSNFFKFLIYIKNVFFRTFK